MDFSQASPAARKEIADLCRQHHIYPLAEKLESLEAYDEGRALGYEYFQGFFFARPTMIKGRAISDAPIAVTPVAQRGQRQRCGLSHVSGARAVNSASDPPGRGQTGH